MDIGAYWYPLRVPTLNPALVAQCTEIVLGEDLGTDYNKLLSYVPVVRAMGKKVAVSFNPETTPAYRLAQAQAAAVAGVDYICWDEAWDRLKNTTGVGFTGSEFNNLRNAAKAIKPDILVGDYEPKGWPADVGVYMNNFLNQTPPPQPDFAGCTLYTCVGQPSGWTPLPYDYDVFKANLDVIITQATARGFIPLYTTSMLDTNMSTNYTAEQFIWNIQQAIDRGFQKAWVWGIGPGGWETAWPKVQQALILFEPYRNLLYSSSPAPINATVDGTPMQSGTSRNVTLGSQVTISVPNTRVQ